MNYETLETYGLASYGLVKGLFEVAVMDIQEQTTVAKVALVVAAVGTVALIHELKG